MLPISNERLQWLEERRFLLGRMIQELTLRQSRYQTRPQHAAMHGQVMQSMLAEQLQLSIEMNALEEFLAEQVAAAFNHSAKAKQAEQLSIEP